MNDTTRRYPRTSVEAFGVSAREACAVERPGSYPPVWWACMLAATVATLILVIFF